MVGDQWPVKPALEGWAFVEAAEYWRRDLVLLTLITSH